MQPTHFDSLHLLGLIAYQRKNLHDAVELIGKAIAVNSTCAPAYSNLSAALQELDRPEEAVASCDRAIELKPDYAEAYYNRGVSLQALSRLEKAVDSYDRAIELKPDYAEAYYNRGISLQTLNRLEKAVASYDRVIELKPDHANAFYYRGVALQELNRPEEAAASYDRAVKLKPDHPETYYNRGVSLETSNRLEEAVASYDRAIELKSDYADAYCKRGFALDKLSRLDEAVASYERAIELKPDYVEAHVNLGKVLYKLTRAEKAVVSYDRAIELKPDCVAAYSNKALALLLMGKFEQGWELFEWRWKGGAFMSPNRDFPQPLWLGNEDIAAKTVLLHAEGGLGDTLQFCRYAKLVKNKGAQVVLEVPKALLTLLAGLEGVDEVVESGKALPAFDYHCPLLSLPLAFKTKLDTVPSPQGYLRADPIKSLAWRERLGAATRPRVGLVWGGGFSANRDETFVVPLRNIRRNIKLTEFAQALSHLDVDFYSLQKGEPAESEIRGREKEFWPNGNFINFTGELNDFSDTAALVNNLDIVVSVDTSTAHLAAALGKPTLILNRFDTCFRWMLDRDDSPWYASVKLYRQNEIGDWSTPLRRVCRDLQRLS